MKKKKIISGALILTSLLLLACSSIAYAEPTPPLPGAPIYDFIDISAEEAHGMLEENPEQFILLDVRTESEYGAGHIPGAINIPVDLENRIAELDKSKRIIVYCQSGGRSKTASGILAQHGFFVYNMEDGISAWKGDTTTATPMPTQTSVATLSPTVTPSPTPAASPSPIASPITTPGVPGFEVTFAIAAISMIAWCMLRKRRKA
jgi:rhodanese-related sulfurtransferase